jgi:hypothetical protein
VTGRNAAPRGDELGQRVSRRIDGESGLERRARLAQLVARGEQGDSRPAANLERAEIGGRGQADAGGSQLHSAMDQNFAFAEVAAGAANEGRRARLRGYADPIAMALNDLPDDYAVRARRHHAAGRDPDRRSGDHGAGERDSRGRVADHGQHGADPRVAQCHRISVHGGNRIGRLVPCRDDVRGERSAAAIGDGQRLGFDRSHIRQQQGPRLIQRDQAHSSRRQWPDLPPLFSTSSIASMRIARSPDFSMS